MIFLQEICCLSCRNRDACVTFAAGLKRLCLTRWTSALALDHTGVLSICRTQSKMCCHFRSFRFWAFVEVSNCLLHEYAIAIPFTDGYSTSVCVSNSVHGLWVPNTSPYHRHFLWGRLIYSNSDRQIIYYHCHCSVFCTLEMWTSVEHYFHDLVKNATLFRILDPLFLDVHKIFLERQANCQTWIYWAKVICFCWNSACVLGPISKEASTSYKDAGLWHNCQSQKKCQSSLLCFPVPCQRNSIFVCCCHILCTLWVQGLYTKSEMQELWSRLLFAPHLALWNTSFCSAMRNCRTALKELAFLRWSRRDKHEVVGLIKSNLLERLPSLKCYVYLFVQFCLSVVNSM